MPLGMGAGSWPCCCCILEESRVLCAVKSFAAFGGLFVFQLIVVEIGARRKELLRCLLEYQAVAARSNAVSLSRWTLIEEDVQGSMAYWYSK